MGIGKQQHITTEVLALWTSWTHQPAHVAMSTTSHCRFYCQPVWVPSPHHNRFTALFPGPPGWAGARRELLDFMVQGKIDRGRHTDHPDGRHSIWTSNQPTSIIPHFLQARCPSCRPTNSVKAPKATSAFGLGRRCQRTLTVLPALSPYCISLYE